MVREQQVGAAAVDVELLAEVAPGHGAALDVPARAPAAPGAVPAGKVRRAGLPQHEVAGVALVGGYVHAGAGDQVVRAAAGQCAVLREAGHREQHVALRGVGVAAGDQCLDDRDHFRHVGGGARLDVGWCVADGRHVGVEVGCGAGGQRADGLAGVGGACGDLVVHVGDVADVGDAGVERAQQPCDHVEHHG